VQWPEVNVWLPAASAIGGALVASLAPIVVGIMNARAEARRERLRLAVQLGIEEHRHLMETARVRAKTVGAATPIGVPPVSATVLYHIQMLDLLQSLGDLEPKDFVWLRERAKAIYEALAETSEQPEMPATAEAARQEGEGSR
jgi:hypothetical protein